MKLKWLVASVCSVAVLGACLGLSLSLPILAYESPDPATDIFDPQEDAQFYFDDWIEVGGLRTYCEAEQNGRWVACSLVLRCPRIDPPDDEFCSESWSEWLDVEGDYVWTYASCQAPDGEGEFDEGPFCLVLTIDGMSDCVSVDVGPWECPYCYCCP